MGKLSIFAASCFLAATLAIPALMPLDKTAQANNQTNTFDTGASVCANIKRDTERLACYDLIHRTPTARLSTIGKWRISTNEGPKNDKGRVIIGLPGERTTLNGQTNLYFFAACRNGSTTLWFNFGRVLNNDGTEVPVSLALDGKTLGLKNLTLSNDQRSIGIFNSDDAQLTLQQIQNGEKLELQLNLDDEQQSKSSFKITNMHNALKPLARACVWDAV